VIQEQPTSRLPEFQAMLPGPHLALVCDSIAAGNTSARIWQLREEGASTLLLWDQGNNVLYLGGQALTGAAIEQLRQLVELTIQPQAARMGRTFFKVRPLVPGLAGAQALCEQWFGRELHEVGTLFFEMGQLLPVRLPDLRLRLAPIDRALLSTSQSINIELIREEIAWMWPSEMRFLSHGFGTAALIDEEIICWCTAEYLSATRCGIGITTHPSYERRGVATVTTARFVEECQHRGILAHWECARENHGSRRVAEKVGLRLVSEETYYTGSLV
jgi:RimJ/RimL family protein N-acetyltransferase